MAATPVNAYRRGGFILRRRRTVRLKLLATHLPTGNPPGKARCPSHLFSLYQASRVPAFGSGRGSMLRRGLCRSMACLVVLAGLMVVPAAAQEAYPTRPVRWVVPFPAGGPTDTLSRILTARLSEI